MEQGGENRRETRAMRLVQAFGRLSPNVRGALWLLASALLFTIMQVMGKYAGQHLNSFQVAFARSFFGLIAILPFLIRAGMGGGGFITNNLPLQILRGVVGSLAMICGFYAITHLPLADAQALNFARGLFLVPLAILVLRELVGPRRLMAAAIGFSGVVVMLRPTGAIEFAALVALVGAALVALATAIPAWLNWVQPSAFELLLLVGVGVFGAAAHNCFIRGYSAGEATAIAPFEYTTLIFAVIGGFLVFGDVPDIWTGVGALIIVGSSLYIVRREAATKNAPPDLRD